MDLKFNAMNIPPLRKSRFTEIFFRENALENSFKEWVFYKGMLFDDLNKWWGDQGRRDTPHEGVDFCFYKDGQGGVHRLNEDMKIPVMYDGVFAGIINDFLGKSVIIEHKLPDNDQIRWCTIYGHTNPVDGLHAGMVVREGDVIATVSGKARAGIIPHLHISTGWSSEVVQYAQLDWEIISARKILRLLDPLQLIDSVYLRKAGT
ncbi:MAG: M23 family metallopeptidase [Nitrospirae bacterium]|nr:M23 family metallopeptidase [Nitrospirota bacterium]